MVSNEVQVPLHLHSHIVFCPYQVSLGPLMLATKFVLVGDHYQLPPLVQVSNNLLMYPIFLFPSLLYLFKYFSFVKQLQSSEARENGMGVSLFWRLSEAHPQAISALRCQVLVNTFLCYILEQLCIFSAELKPLVPFEFIVCLGAVSHVIRYHGAVEFIDLRQQVVLWFIGNCKCQTQVFWQRNSAIEVERGNTPFP